METIIGLILFITGFIGLLIPNINWHWEGFDVFKKGRK